MCPHVYFDYLWMTGLLVFVSYYLYLLVFQIFRLDPYFFQSIIKKKAVIMHPGDFYKTSD